MGLLLPTEHLPPPLGVLVGQQERKRLAGNPPLGGPIMGGT